MGTVIDNLRVDMLVTAKNTQTRFLGGAKNLSPDAATAIFPGSKLCACLCH
jgi:hypothetical protein